MKNSFPEKQRLRLLAAILILSFLACGASALAVDYLGLYRDSLSAEAIAAASIVKPPEELTEAEAAAYRLGFAMGFDDATGYTPPVRQSTQDMVSARLIQADGLRAAASAEQTYILNTSSKKFHRPDCRSAKSIDPENKAVFVGTKEELYRRGYQPCKNCDP